MKLPETKTQVLYDIDRWQNILISQEWVLYVNLVKEHCLYLQKEVNDHLRVHEDRQAGEALRALDDCKRLLDLVSNRMKALHDQTEKLNKKGEK